MLGELSVTALVVQAENVEGFFLEGFVCEDVEDRHEAFEVEQFLFIDDPFDIERVQKRRDDHFFLVRRSVHLQSLEPFADAFDKNNPLHARRPEKGLDIQTVYILTS